MNVFLRDKKITLNPSSSIGKGGEADVFNIGGGLAVKIFKPKNHPDLSGNTTEQEAAVKRIEEHQKKLPSLLTKAKSLPQNIVVPIDLVHNNSKHIVGYSMKLVEDCEVLLRYSQRSFREAGISNEDVIKIFVDLHKTVSFLHQSNFVIGDFNNLNILVVGTRVYVIDADSFQFDSYFCRVFTEKFVDPLLCDPYGKRPVLVKPHNSLSDWYAFTVMLMECLLFVDPYGGIYNPKNKKNDVLHCQRPLKRITVFHQDVKYPRPATPYNVLPDDLLELFHRIFEKDERKEVPLKLIESIRWTKCLNCGTQFAKNKCPVCAQEAPAAIKEVTVVRGMVTATRIFKTHGQIVYACYQGNNMRWLYHDGECFKREDESTVVKTEINPHMRFRIQGRTTLIGQKEILISYLPDGSTSKKYIDCFGTLPMFDAQESKTFWLSKGQLMKSGDLSDENIGSVLAGQTLFWIGVQFGFGFYRAGQIQIAFIFDARAKGINDNVKLPRLSGQFVDSTCVFTSKLCWFFTSTRESGKNMNRCYVLDISGNILGTSEAEEGDGSWLGTIRGKCATGNILFAGTDEGISRVEIENGRISLVKEFPDTAHFVNSGCHLFVGKDGIYSVKRSEITRLQIK